MGDYLATSLPVFDIIVVFLICWGGYKGFQKGFLVEVLSIFIFLLLLFWMYWGLVTLMQFSQAKAGVGPPKAGAFLIFTLFFVLIVAAVAAISKRIGWGIEVFEGFDNIMGMMFAVVKYAISLSLFLEILIMAGVVDRNTLLATKTYPLLNSIYEFIINVGGALAPSVKEVIQNIQFFLS